VYEHLFRQLFFLCVAVPALHILAITRERKKSDPILIISLPSISRQQRTLCHALCCCFFVCCSLFCLRGKFSGDCVYTIQINFLLDKYLLSFKDSRATAQKKNSFIIVLFEAVVFFCVVLCCSTVVEPHQNGFIIN
jgi:hypothetical protein